MLIDPPFGSDYGFPKRLPEGWQEDPDFDVVDWLVYSGYPQHLIDEMGSYFMYRVIGEH
jgi:hypothetical protein